MKITVIIPVKNGAATLERCLSSIRLQTIKDVEILVLDSMSDDNSRQIAQQYDARVIDIARGSFNHGTTRNLGVQHATGELIYLTVQDASLANEHMLEQMSAHFKNAEVQAVVGHQAIPKEQDKNPLKWRKTFSQPQVQERRLEDVKQLNGLTDGEQRSILAWDNVVAMYRRTALLELPFIATDFAEDWIWSREALLKRWLLIHDPNIVVYHYHHQTYRYAYQVNYAVNYHFYKFLHLKPGIPPLLKSMAEATYHLVKHPALNVKQKLYWIGHNYVSALATFNSHINFLFHLRMAGLPGIEKRYKKICKTVPQGSQK